MKNVEIEVKLRLSKSKEGSGSKKMERTRTMEAETIMERFMIGSGGILQTQSAVCYTGPPTLIQSDSIQLCGFRFCFHVYYTVEYVILFL